MWPWFREFGFELFATEKPANKELDDLNTRPLPTNVAYTLIFSESVPTIFTETFSKKLLPIPPAYRISTGDGIVPTFSMRGLQVDPNNPNAIPAPIPAFTGVPIYLINIPGFHVGYLQQSDVMQQVVALLTL